MEVPRQAGKGFRLFGDLPRRGKTVDQLRRDTLRGLVVLDRKSVV